MCRKCNSIFISAVSKTSRRDIWSGGIILWLDRSSTLKICKNYLSALRKGLSMMRLRRLCLFCSFNSVWFSTLVNIIVFTLFNNHDHFHSALLLSFLPCLLFIFQKKFSPACLQISEKCQPACLFRSALVLGTSE